MTISFPVSMPPTRDVNTFQLFPETVNAISISKFTLQQQVQSHDGDLWGLRISSPMMNRADAQEWMSFITSLRGQFGTFLFQPSLFSSTLGSALSPGTPMVDGAGQTGYTLDTTQWTPSSPDILKAGDLFQIDEQLYMNLTDATPDGGGNVTLDIWPRARNHVNNSTIITDDPAGIFRLSEKAPKAVSFGTNHLFSTTLSAFEAK